MYRMAVPPLVRASWLNQQIKDGVKNLRILDGSWFLPNANREPEKEFYQKRIPGARYFDIDECRDKSNPYDHMLPSEAEFASYVQNLGITNDSHVVVYDNNEKLGVFSAPRVWWTFRAFGHERVSVLDGGLPKWCSEGFPTESGPLKEESFKDNPPFKATLNKAMIVDYDFIMNNIKSEPRVTVLDARPPGRFTGDEPEPRPDLPSGHMPQSRSFPFGKCLDMENKCLKSPEALKKVFADAGVDLTKPLVTSCGSGVTGSGLLFGTFLCGKTDTKLYDGSWTEFVQRAPEEMNLKGK
ncbi:3-mercaptopyruvate sulfurtransferase-like [Nematostella vectensis]|uniref:3-mercaptopyruvate sulfurtransferase-like n=1 Tax=Nematostella vectensis TaxID=45351 RepID=UPI0020773C5F|nr:3-mercaptopyruvate sulfurtransferase-like [Nematostella vectensis]